MVWATEIYEARVLSLPYYVEYSCCCLCYELVYFFMASAEVPVVDWTKCLVCQCDKTEELRGKIDDNSREKTYETLAKMHSLQSVCFFSYL